MTQINNNITYGLLYGKAHELSSMANDPSLSKLEKVGTSCQLFEGAMVRQLMNDAMKPTEGGFLGGKEGAGSVYHSMAIDTIAMEISKSGVFGVGNLLQSQLQHKGLTNDKGSV